MTAVEGKTIATSREVIPPQPGSSRFDSII